MNRGNVRRIADAVMYEGYLLYPYRPSSVKNRQRWTIGGLYPPRSERGSCSFQSQMLVECETEPEIDATVRFLELCRREDGVEEGEPREVGPGKFAFAARGRQAGIEGSVEIVIKRITSQVHRVTLRVTNRSAGESPLGVMASTHAILHSANGAFASLTDPPGHLRAAAAQCANRGVWPVLAGEPGSRDCMLVSPIILSDYPAIAPESPGDLFDGAEIDEILSLRILTLTDGEKEEMRAADRRTRDILQRTESLSAGQMMRLHGAFRDPRGSAAAASGTEMKRGDKVRLRPQKQADIMDLALAGQVAEIESVETDYEGRTHVAVVLDDDPGKDLGMLRQPGHRFFFEPHELEPIVPGDAR